MKRLEKIVLEQTRKSKPGWAGKKISTNAVKAKADQLNAISFLFYYVFGKKESPIDKRGVAGMLPKLTIYGNDSIYSQGEYFYVIGEDYKENEGTNKAVIYYPIYIIRQSESDIEILIKFRIGGTDKAPIIDINDFQTIQDAIKKKKADAEAAAIAAAEKNNPAIEKTIVAVQNVINGTATIDVNNLGKGTPDAKAFQELIYQVGMKLHPSNTYHKKFAEYRTKGPGNDWGGFIGNITLSALHQINGPDNKRLTVKWNAGDKVGVIEELRKTLATVNESTNYFKGTGINTKLKDLIKEHLINEQGTAAEEEVYVPTNSTTTVTTTPNTTNTTNTTSSTNFTQATFPANYTGKGKIIYNNGNTFTGEWQYGIKLGPGTFTFANGNTYTGDWVAGLPNGQGTFSGKDGMSYTGAWLNNKYHGQGTYTWPNGNTYTGNFQNNLRNGDGKFYNAETKTTTQQTWKDGEKLLGIDDLYTQSVTNMSAVLLQLVNYVNNHEQFAGYKSMDDDEAAALIDLVKPWVQSNIQPKVTAHYNKYIKPYMSQYNVSDAALTVEYDEEFVGTNDSVTNIQNDKFRKMIQNYLVLEANSSDTALDDPATSAAYYNYAGDKSSYTIPAMFYWNKERSVHYWSLIGGRALFNVDTDF